ncbi:MAG: biotin/lipoyl-binding protein, partial [Hydrogenophilaceae bacterium]|nr:biotin/lipoyl-binding protein [Hydrogenophilaceae bacterium]
MIRRKYWRSAGAAAVFVAIVGLAGCGQQQQQQQQSAPPPPAVTVAAPTQRTITDFDEYVGRFVAVDSVEVRARVSGYLESIHFKDGQMVKEGDLLFTIDKRPFQTALDQAKATLQKARAE